MGRTPRDALGGLEFDEQTRDKSGMSENTDYAKMFARFPFALRRFLKQRITLDQAKQIVRERLEHREENFLLMLQQNVYGSPTSPYLPLLKHAGCEMGDVQTVVRKRGLDDALKALRKEGVYVTFEEFKGRKPIERNGLTLEVKASDFDNPFAANDLAGSSSGSTGAAVKVAIDMDHVAERGANRMIALDAHGVLYTPYAAWRGIMPDRTMGQMLFGALIGNMPERWFSPNGLRDSKQWIKYGLGTYYLVLCMRLARVNLPFPEYIKPERAVEIARWAAGGVKRHGRYVMRAGTSRAVHVCVAAEKEGLDLSGVTFIGAGEPATPGKMQQIQKVGAHFISNYGMSEAGQPACGCVNPLSISDYHLYTDSFALFSEPYYVPAFDLNVPAFNMTALLPHGPKVMVNVQIDDYGIVEERHCGCPLEEFGYRTHLREIRSYSKLTGEGVTLIGNEVIQVLERALPARFGGSALDYQLMEQEGAQGLTRVYLIVSPRISIENESDVVDCFLDGLKKSSPMADAARLVWQNANTIQVKRMEPIWGNSGKFLPLYIPARHKQTLL